MKYVCIIPHSVSVKKFMEHLNKNEYKNATTVAELNEINKLEFTYLQIAPKEIRNKIYQMQTKFSHSFILKNQIQFKSDLHKMVHEKNPKFFGKYFLQQYDISLDNMSALNNLQEDSLYIIKPTKSFKGLGNKVFRGRNGIKKYIRHNEKKHFAKSREKGKNQWVIQKYMENPLLLNGKKFHIRWLVLLTNKKVYMYELGVAFPSAVKYDPNDLNMKVHDTHGESAPPSEHKAFPNDFFDEPYTQKVFKDVYQFLKGMKDMRFFEYNCFEEAQDCFGIIGIDFMINSDYELKCIEINNRPGYTSSFNHAPCIVKGLLDLTLKGKKNGKGYLEIK